MVYEHRKDEEALGVSEYTKLEDMPEKPEEKHIVGLLWCRLHVTSIGRDSQSAWVTDWKWLRASWYYWTGTQLQGTPQDPENWYIDNRDPNIRFSIEATHYTPLPEPPEGDWNDGA